MWCVTVILFGIGNASHFCGWGRKWGRKNKRKRYRTVNIGNTEVYMYSCLDLYIVFLMLFLKRSKINEKRINKEKTQHLPCLIISCFVPSFRLISLSN